MAKRDKIVVKYTNNVVVGKVKKSGATSIVVSLLAKDGVKYLHLHEWYKTKKSSEWRPGIRSISVPIQLPPLPDVPTHPMDELMGVISEALTFANTDFKIDDPANYIYNKPKNKEE